MDQGELNHAWVVCLVSCFFIFKVNSLFNHINIFKNILIFRKSLGNFGDFTVVSTKAPQRHRFYTKSESGALMIPSRMHYGCVYGNPVISKATFKPPS